MYRVLSIVSPTYLIVPGWWLGLFVNLDLDPEVEIYLQGTSSIFFSYLSFTHCFVDDTMVINISYTHWSKNTYKLIYRSTGTPLLFSHLN